MRKLLIATALGAGLFAGAAAAQDIKIALIYGKTGPLEAYAKQTETGLRMIKGPKGANYNVTAAVPAVTVGQPLRLQGVTTDKYSPCGGVVLDNVKWVPTRGSCPK